MHHMKPDPSFLKHLPQLDAHTPPPRLQTKISAGTLTTLVVIKSTLDTVIKYLNLIDTLVRHCSPDTPQ